MRRVKLGRVIGLSLLGLAVMAAAPSPRALYIVAQPAQPPVLGVPGTPGQAAGLPPGRFEPAPLPNRDIDAPSGGRASTAPSLSPSLFNRTDTYRGDGFSRGSTAAAEQEKRVKPGAGFSLKMPLAPN